MVLAEIRTGKYKSVLYTGDRHRRTSLSDTDLAPCSTPEEALAHTGYAMNVEELLHCKDFNHPALFADARLPLEPLRCLAEYLDEHASGVSGRDRYIVLRYWTKTS